MFVTLDKALYPHMLHLTEVGQIDDNVYDKFNALKWLHEFKLIIK